VERVPPSAVVFERTFLTAAVLTPLALRSGAFRELRGRLIPLVLVAMLDMAQPTFLTVHDRQLIPAP
jgi:hypothetical protein